MIFRNNGDHYVVELHNLVTISKDNAVNNFKQYLLEIEKEFNRELTKTIYIAMDKGLKL